MAVTEGAHRERGQERAVQSQDTAELDPEETTCVDSGKETRLRGVPDCRRDPVKLGSSSHSTEELEAPGRTPEPPPRLSQLRGGVTFSV